MIFLAEKKCAYQMRKRMLKGSESAVQSYAQEKRDCHLWDVTDGEHGALTSEGWFDEIFQMCVCFFFFFAKYEVNKWCHTS